MDPAVNCSFYGQGCINFRDRDPLPLEDIAKVVRHAIERGKGG